jgi:hypothetical protein
MKKKILNDQSGFSLMEVMVAAAIAIVIAMGMAKMSQNASKSVTKMKTDTELEDFKAFIKTNMSRGDNCSNTFEDLDWDMLAGGTRDDSALPVADQIIPPGIDPGTQYRKMSSSGGDFSDIDIVTVTDDVGATTGSFTLEAGSPIPSYPNWTIEELRVYNVANNGGGDGDPNTGLCLMYFKVERIAGLNSTRSFGAGELIFWIKLSCAVHAEDVAAAPPNPAKKKARMAYCVEDQAVVPGFWSLEDDTDPTKGIRYNDDVYVGNHLIVESDQNIKRDDMVIDNASDKLSQIDGLYYFLRHEEFPNKNYSTRRQIGFFAQQLEPIFPEMVNTNKETNFKSVRYSMMIPVLVEAHKEQEQKIKDQEDQIRILNRKVDKLLKLIKSNKK